MDESQVQEETKREETTETAEEISKEDWENILEQIQKQRKAAMMAVEQDTVLFNFVTKKIAEFEDSDEEMPEDIKDIVKEIKDG